MVEVADKARPRVGAPEADEHVVLPMAKVAPVKSKSVGRNFRHIPSMEVVELETFIVEEDEEEHR